MEVGSSAFASLVASSRRKLSPRRVVFSQSVGGRSTKRWEWVTNWDSDSYLELCTPASRENDFMEQDDFRVEAELK